MSVNDTIAAVATAPGESSIAVVRSSGQGVKDLIRSVFRTPSGKKAVLPTKRVIRYGFVVDPVTEEKIDECILLWMPGTKSYTAEDSCEFQVHGGFQSVNLTLNALMRSGVRIAEPGEFTKRAFLNGRIDLSQAEAVMDLIQSKTEAANKAAFSSLQGKLHNEIIRLRKQVLRLQAHVEVHLDYPEHDDEEIALVQVIQEGEQIHNSIHWLREAAVKGRILREGIKVAIVGKPNVGKSSLMNLFLGRDRAIVTDIPGTTRDVIEEYISLNGVPIKIVDTAGIRITEDLVERIGVEKSHQEMESADLILLLLDVSRPLEEEDFQLFSYTQSKRRIIVINKIDEILQWDIDEIGSSFFKKEDRVVKISIKAEKNLNDLNHEIVSSALGSQQQDFWEGALMANARQLAWLNKADESLQEAIEAASFNVTLDVIAVSLQECYKNLGWVIGEQVGEDLLDEIFSNFCLGK
ncbi:tRNA uridine-5-carboxymethylaminomethyl(34) synthesis GTPase MnmE [Alicyclobacillus sp. TC]|uniref:tRNA uridine-5-carboxymethylaminomethyl(34) synthesis GTPase MnmE n=1 Tax=Alicyclobacillus sp. TC TaxID=2606450 RepID=UPI001934073E|nr:tRNA uridine-5-carboxymethylaminomethyl(34) synthesis GTPase MnmE [Alicyclobacillus sp. TC]QRF24539.1 tRNA uridine-5-carboxymethylaminomethyl(34) synthesis GTPase MnmE [Alicyclobacillus sp. TC]